VTTTDIHALAGAYVLDAVNDLERVAFTRHLAECDACRTEVDEMREAAARLADGAWSVPPPRLREDVMAAIGRTRQLPPGSPVPVERDVSAVVSRWRRFTAGAAAAGILAAGAGAATWAIQEQRVRDASAIAAAATAREQRTQAILSASDVQVKTTFISGGGRVTVAMSPSHHAGVVLLSAAVPPGRDMALQLWLVHGATQTSAGVLAPGSSSTVRIVDGMPGSDAFGVTLEPAGGSPTPTLPMVAQISLT
jgi:anti-sigma-K factor RskA